jgi:hypothetical protein
MPLRAVTLCIQPMNAMHHRPYITTRAVLMAIHHKAHSCVYVIIRLCNVHRLLCVLRGAMNAVQLHY